MLQAPFVTDAAQTLDSTDLDCLDYIRELTPAMNDAAKSREAKAYSDAVLAAHAGEKSSARCDTNPSADAPSVIESALIRKGGRALADEVMELARPAIIVGLYGANPLA